MSERIKGDKDMEIIKAKSSDLLTVKNITITTIESIYPHYYPRGVVEFFLLHHNDESILKDIENGYVYIMYDDKRNQVATITLVENEIHRLFVLPQYQKMGFGRQLMHFAEKEISKQYDMCLLDASLPAKLIYLKKGYMFVESHVIETKSGDFLCYDVMKKNLKGCEKL